MSTHTHTFNGSDTISSTDQNVYFGILFSDINANKPTGNNIRIDSVTINIRLRHNATGAFGIAVTGETEIYYKESTGAAAVANDRLLTTQMGVVPNSSTPYSTGNLGLTINGNGDVAHTNSNGAAADRIVVRCGLSTFVSVTWTMTYTVTWNYTVFYKVTWENYDRTVLETDEAVEHNTTPTYNGATPTRAKTAQYTYTFSEWSPDVSAITGDTVYTAQFNATVNKYTITWKNYDGSVLKTESLEYGATLSYSGTTPTRAYDSSYHYTFKGWDKTVVAVTGAATYTATFTAVAHEYSYTSNSNGTHKGTCSCGHTKTENCSFGDWVQTKAPTCTAKGTKQRTCSVCGYVETADVAATGHSKASAVIENRVEATCTADGSYDEVVYCSVCGEEISCTTKTITKLGHSYKSVVTAPTCTEQGYTTHTCSRCGHSYQDTYTSATGHSWDSGEITAVGERTYTCQNDSNHTKTETIPPPVFTSVDIFNSKTGQAVTAENRIPAGEKFTLAVGITTYD